MKKLIVYYSYEGNTKNYVEALAEAIGAESLALKPVKEMKSKGFSKFVWGGYQAVMKKKPKLENYEFKASDYETIIFAAPVWAGSYAPPLRSFFAEEDILAKKVAYFFTHEGGIGKTVQHFEEALADNHLLGGFDLNTNKVGPDLNKDKLISWAKSIDL